MHNMLKKLFISVVAALSFCIPSAFASGIPVVDAAAISQDAANFIQEMAKMVEQLSTMKSQLEQQVKQYQSLTGDRGMGGLMNNQIRNYIPDEWQSAIDLLNQPSGYSGIADKIQDIINKNKVLSDSELDKQNPEAQEMIVKQRQSVATYQALTQAAYDNASKRFAALQTLTNQIGAATDPKAIMDLQARIQSEQTQLQNESNKLQTFAQARKADEAAESQRVKEFIINGAGRIENMPQVNL